MKDLNKIIKALRKKGFTMTQNDGTRAKLYPPDKSQPFYSLHLDNSGKAYFPLARFSKQHWGIDLNAL